MALWMVTAGDKGQRCLENNFIAMNGWVHISDLSTFKDIKECKNAHRSVYASMKQESADGLARQAWTFSHLIRPGDLIVLPINRSPFVAFGEVMGAYRYTTEYGEGIRHILPVKWLDKEVRRDRLDQDIQNALYSSYVYQIKRNDAEVRIRALLSGQAAPQPSVTEGELDESSVQPDWAEGAKEEIVSFINENFKGHALEELVEAVLIAQGYTTDRTSPGADGGVDILAGLGLMGFGSPRIAVQVKSGEASVGVEVVRQLSGILQKFHADYGLLVCLGGYKASVKREFRQDYFKIRLWDQEDLLQAIFAVYEKLPEAMQARVPLQRSWVLIRPPEDSM